MIALLQHADWNFILVGVCVIDGIIAVLALAEVATWFWKERHHR